MAWVNRVGIMGDGQLARMLIQDGRRLGIDCIALGENPSSSAACVGAFRQVAYDDAACILAQCQDRDVLTYEMEHLPADALDAVARDTPFHPTIAALRLAQDRLLEKQFLEQLGVSVAPYRALHAPEDVEEAVHALGMPCVIKTRTHGYDGKGQHWVHSAADIDEAIKLVRSRTCLVESLCRFDQELSMLAVRGLDGAIVSYPLVRNEHRDGVLRKTTAPAPGLPPLLMTQAEEVAHTILDPLKYVGALCIEFFAVGDALWVNELAPRVHNSFHWTIEGAGCGQFENHLRAITGRPLGSTEAIGSSVMYNILGEMPSMDEVLKTKNARVHLYDKSPSLKRKIGHITACHHDVSELERIESRLDKLLRM